MIEILNGTRETVNYEGNIGIMVHDNDKVEDYPLHWHTDMEIITTMENIYTFEIEGEKKVINQGEILIIPSGELHRLYAPESGRRLISLFDCSLLYSFPSFNYTFYHLKPYALLTRADMGDVLDDMIQILIKISEEYFSASPFKEAACYALLINFFVLLSRNQGNQKSLIADKGHVIRDNRYIGRFQEVCNYINDHCTEDLTVDKLASIAGYSTYHFARLFKKYMNVTFYNYLLRRRVMTAEKLLVHPDLTIMQAALQSGFDNLSTFNRVFKKHKNCTPSEFISLNRPNNIHVLSK